MATRQCSYCASEGPLTREHLWPASLHRRLLNANDQQENLFWLARLNQEIKGEPTIRDVCAECNNVRLSKLDDYICGLFDRYFVHILERNEVVIFEFDYHRLKRWLLKMCFNSARIHSSIDVIAFPPLLSYINGESLTVGRSVQLYLQLSYPSEVSEDAVSGSMQPGGSFVFRPTMNRVGNLWFDVSGVGRKLLRAVHLRSFSFYLAFFKLDESRAILNDFSREFLGQLPMTELLRPSQPRIELVCNGIDAWQAFKNSRDIKFTTSE